MKALITGATGFVGTALCPKLFGGGYEVVPAVRRKSGLPHEVVVGNLDASTHWHPALTACDVVVHLAARVHVMGDSAQNPLMLYRLTNLDATLNLACQAAQAGVKRFVYISTIKVNGEGRDAPYRASDAPAPEDAYAMSKWEAEQGLAEIARQTGMEVVILRPPLIYGPGVGANFLRLMQTVEWGLPLPVGAICNRRSLLFLDNFIDVIRISIEHPAAAGQTFLLDDGETISTPELIRALATALHRPARLLPVPVGVLQLVGWMTGNSAAASRLTGSLYVDSQPIRDRLGWTPRYSLKDGLAATAAAFRTRLEYPQEAQ